MLKIRGANARDRAAIWSLLEPVIRAGETYALPVEMKRPSALAYWFGKHHDVFVAEDTSRIVGTYFIQPNQKGGGSHVANCGYITASHATGKGVARAMRPLHRICPIARIPRHPVQLRRQHQRKSRQTVAEPRLHNRRPPAGGVPAPRPRLRRCAHHAPRDMNSLRYPAINAQIEIPPHRHPYLYVRCTLQRRHEGH